MLWVLVLVLCILVIIFGAIAMLSLVVCRTIDKTPINESFNNFADLIEILEPYNKLRDRWKRIFIIFTILTILLISSLFMIIC